MAPSLLTASPSASQSGAGNVCRTNARAMIGWETGCELQGVEVGSITLGLIFESFKSFRLLKPFKSFTSLASQIFVENGIGFEDLDGEFKFRPIPWHPAVNFIACLHQIREMLGARVLIDAGLAVPRYVGASPRGNSVISALTRLDIVHHMNHRLNGRMMFDPWTGAMLEGIGHYVLAKEAPASATIVAEGVPYPCEFDHGIIMATAAQFESSAVVTHDESAPCRTKGGRSCTYRVTWP